MMKKNDRPCFDFNECLFMIVIPFAFLLFLSFLLLTHNKPKTKEVEKEITFVTDIIDENRFDYIVNGDLLYKCFFVDNVIFEEYDSYLERCIEIGYDELIIDNVKENGKYLFKANNSKKETVYLEYDFKKEELKAFYFINETGSD